MTKTYDVAIIGAGTAGLTARAEIAKHTDNYVVIDGGTLGTTCARVGCMPSKSFIAIAKAYHSQQGLEALNLENTKAASPDYAKVMRHVRHLRDRFVAGVEKDMQSWSDHLIQKHARFIDPNTLDLGDETVHADKIIIATGSKPVIPEPWRKHARYLIDTDRLFELETLPHKVAVFGLGPVGVELAQALTRIGIDVICVTQSKAIGGLTDPDIQNYAFQILAQKMNIRIGSAEIVGENGNRLTVGCKDETWSVDRVLVAVGRRPTLDGLGLENLGVELDGRGLPLFDETTFQIENLPVFIVGDANGLRPLLHEAADEGRIAGYNAMAKEVTCFQKRIYLGITFSEPNIAVIGKSYKSLSRDKTDFVIGESDYEHQGRAIMMGQNEGKVRLYARKTDSLLLGAELITPHGEHLAHLLAWAIGYGMRAVDILSMPFYHPVLEEGLRSAFRQATEKSTLPKPQFEMLRCQDSITG
jgi:dihydrolipoamide dehydrogenase